MNYVPFILAGLGVLSVGAATVFPKYAPMLMPLGTFLAGWAVPNKPKNGTGKSIPPPPGP